MSKCPWTSASGEKGSVSKENSRLLNGLKGGRQADSLARLEKEEAHDAKLNPDVAFPRSAETETQMMDGKTKRHF